LPDNFKQIQRDIIVNVILLRNIRNTSGASTFWYPTI